MQELADAFFFCSRRLTSCLARSLALAYPAQACDLSLGPTSSAFQAVVQAVRRLGVGDWGLGDLERDERLFCEVLFGGLSFACGGCGGRGLGELSAVDLCLP